MKVVVYSKDRHVNHAAILVVAWLRYSLLTGALFDIEIIKNSLNITVSLNNHNSNESVERIVRVGFLLRCAADRNMACLHCNIRLFEVLVRK